MKKIASLIFVLALILSLSIPAFATGQGGTQDVTAKYEKTQTEETIYNVDIAWGDLTFTYSENTTKEWNPATHTYTETTTGGWNKTKTELVVTNHSNVSVVVSMSLTPVEGTGITATLTGGNATLAAGTEGDVDGAASVTGTLEISGTPNDTVTESGIKVASITITVE